MIGERNLGNGDTPQRRDSKLVKDCRNYNGQKVQIHVLHLKTKDYPYRWSLL